MQVGRYCLQCAHLCCRQHLINNSAVITQQAVQRCATNSIDLPKHVDFSKKNMNPEC